MRWLPHAGVHICRCMLQLGTPSSSDRVHVQSCSVHAYSRPPSAATKRCLPPSADAPGMACHPVPLGTPHKVWVGMPYCFEHLHFDPIPIHPSEGEVWEWVELQLCSTVWAFPPPHVASHLEKLMAAMATHALYVYIWRERWSWRETRIYSMIQQIHEHF